MNVIVNNFAATLHEDYMGVTWGFFSALHDFTLNFACLITWLSHLYVKLYIPLCAHFTSTLRPTLHQLYAYVAKSQKCSSSCFASTLHIHYVPYYTPLRELYTIPLHPLYTRFTPSLHQLYTNITRPHFTQTLHTSRRLERKKTRSPVGIERATSAL